MEFDEYSKLVCSAILDALAALALDPVWADSGVREYLQQALKLERDSCTIAARNLAIQTLGFRRLAEEAAARNQQETPSCEPRKRCFNTACQPSANNGSAATNSPFSATPEVSAQQWHYGCAPQQPHPTAVADASAHLQQHSAGGPTPLQRCDSFGVSYTIAGHYTGISADSLACSTPSAGGRSSDDDTNSTCSFARNGFAAYSGGDSTPRASKRQRTAATCFAEPPLLSCSHAATQALPHAQPQQQQQQACASQQPTQLPPPQPPQRTSSAVPAPAAAHQPNWQGHVCYRSGAAVICGVSLVVPPPCLDQFPCALHVTQVLPRRRVSLGRHVVVRCSLESADERQLAGLASLAQRQLVAVVPLPSCELHLVPYHDNSNAVRMVGFLKV